MKRKVLPKNMGGLRHIPFDGQDDDDDARSVRRHRVDLEGVPEKIRFDMAGKEGAQTEIELLPQTETQVLSPRKKLLRGLSFKSNK
ncbi:hypothetical protein CDD82_3586 [Ophiocordyceps australis]|uniref:Uncharacterized protein n=1 Tax=Ophiocordyceps australis TaxID=1399860 RepID=A0A2C5ZDJ3_9HYPO|nr:hypothetical protein CDD82_3586 [Ophiocordyceps australis]